MQNPNKLFLLSLFTSAVNACLPKNCLPNHLHSLNEHKQICVLGAGKAAGQMAAVMYETFGERVFGTVVSRYGHDHQLATGKIKVLEASHPIPDENSVIAAEAMLNQARQNNSDIPIVFLISGGGSSLMCLPTVGMKLQEKVELTQFLLKSGATINEINSIRKYFSQIKGGRLAAATNSPILSLVISDVVGDDPELIASGPTVGNSKNAHNVLALLKRYQYPQYGELKRTLNGCSSDVENTRGRQTNELRIIANGQLAIDNAVQLAESVGWNARVINYEQEGEASVVAEQHASIALQAKNKGERVILFCGGELTVSLGDANGRGGPNQEYLLALAIALKSEAGISAISCDTDGIDGSEEIAGAFIDETTLERAVEIGIKAAEKLSTHDSFGFFDTLGDSVITGQTCTNVNDFRAIMINR